MSVRFAEQEGKKVIYLTPYILAAFPFVTSTYIVLLRTEGRLKLVVVLEAKGFIPDLQISDGAFLEALIFS